MIHVSGLHRDSQGLCTRATLHLGMDSYGALTTADGEPFMVEPSDTGILGWPPLDGPAVELSIPGRQWAYVLPQATYDRLTLP